MCGILSLLNLILTTNRRKDSKMQTSTSNIPEELKAQLTDEQISILMEAMAKSEANRPQYDNIDTVEKFENAIGRELKMYRSFDEMKSNCIQRYTTKQIARLENKFWNDDNSFAKTSALFDEHFGDVVDGLDEQGQIIKNIVPYDKMFLFVLFDRGVVETYKWLCAHDRSGNPIAE